MIQIDYNYIIFQQINNFAGRYLWLDTLAIFFAEYLGYVLVGSLVIFLLVNTKAYWPMVWQAFAAAILSRFVITEIIRWIWFLPRPFVKYDVNLLIHHANTASFPSGHAAFYIAFAPVVYFYNKKAGALFFVAGFLISASRVFVGVHWPSDILAGAVIAILSGVFIRFLSKRFSKK